jgi:hypothetical protein
VSVLRLAGFAGENRALHPTLLPDPVGTVSRNQKPGRGDLRAWLQPLNVATVPSGRTSIYRMGRDVASDSQYWLSWTTVVHAVRGFDPDDTTERTYYTGDGAPKVTDNTIGLATAPYPTASRPLGIPAPVAAPTLTAAGGGVGQLATAFYVYTYVNDWGWESAPSPVSAANTRKSDDTATLSAFSAVPSGNYGITAIRIYRTATGASGATEFFYLREIAIGTASTTDDNRSLGEVLETTTWLPAPGVPRGGAAGGSEANLSNLTALWNGMLAGIVNNRVRFCEPYIAYAWPDEYDVVPPDSKAVALGVFGQQLLVLTTGRPLIVAGSGPDSLDHRPLEIPQGCVASRSVVSMGNGVAWASEDGLCWFGAGGGSILTAGTMTRTDWRALVPSSIIGRMYEGLYFGSYSTDGGTTRQGFMIDPSNPTGIYFLDSGYAGTHFDELQDQLYVLSGTNVQRWDAGASSMTYRFRSKVFELPKPENLAALEVKADSYPVTVRIDALNLSATAVSALVAQRPAVFSAPTSTTFRYTVSVTSGDAVPLPGGFLTDKWQIELEGTGAVQSAAMASSVDELKQV